MDSISKACTTEYKDQKHFTKAFAHLKEVKKETPRPTVYYALNPEQSVNSKLPPTPDTEDQLNTWYKRIKKHQKGSKNLFLGNHIVADTTITKEQKARLDTLFSTQDDHAAVIYFYVSFLKFFPIYIFSKTPLDISNLKVKTFCNL